MPAKVLLVSGVHLNESCSQPLAERVLARLRATRADAVHYHVPANFTLLGVLDDPDASMDSYAVNGGILDMDLARLEEELREQYAERLIFEFHNYADCVKTDKLYAEPGLRAQHFEIGNIGPGRVGPFAVGWRQHEARGGTPGKYSIEVPAAYVPVPYEKVARRMRTLQDYFARGIDLPQEDKLHAIREYLVQQADETRSREKGYLDEVLAVNLADWILMQTKQQ